MRRVTILQEYVPHYRAPFFSELSDLAAEHEIEVVVEHGNPNADLALRGDSASSANFLHRQVRISQVRVRGRQVAARQLSSQTIASELVICEQARRNLELYLLLGRRYLWRRPLIALWGHGIDYTVDRTRGELWLQRQLTRRADWFFGYTPASVQHAIKAGVSPDRTTVVMNAIDSAALAEELSRVSEQEIVAFRTRNGIPARAALFIGGLDPAKRVELLVAAAIEAHKADPDFAVMVIGDGAGHDLLGAAISTGAVIHLGSQFGRDKVLALRSATSLAVPGRVGLVAVDALVSGLPIVTAAGSLHAPEVDYLTPGVNLFTTDATPAAYGRQLLAASPTTTMSEIPTVEAMARNFLSGIEAALDHFGRLAP